MRDQDKDPSTLDSSLRKYDFEDDDKERGALDLELIPVSRKPFRQLLCN